MLPTDVLQRIINCPGIRTWPLRGEKRRVPRIPHRRRVLLHPIDAHDTLLPPVSVWLKDISTLGVGILTPNGEDAGLTFLLRFGAVPSPRNSRTGSATPPRGRTPSFTPGAHDDEILTLCRVARTRSESDLFSLLGAEFTHLLITSDLPDVGDTLETTAWQDLSPDLATASTVPVLH